MNWSMFFKRDLKFRKRLVRLHHSNAILFFLLSITGLLLYSPFFRSTFPATRVWMKDAHIWIGFISVMPILFYLPKMGKHLLTLRKWKNHRINLYFIFVILFTLILSGLILTFQRHFPPLLSSYSLIIHDIATWIGLPYVIYHSVTRSLWYKRLLYPKEESTNEQDQEPTIIDKSNPLLKRRTFLRRLSGGIIALFTILIVGNWLKTYFPVNKSDLSGGNKMVPLPETDNKLLSSNGKQGEFRYYTITEMPTFTNENWSLTVDGLVDKKLDYNWEQFLQLERSSQLSDFHCITGWSVYNITWEGIPLKKLLEKAGVNQQAKYVKFYSGDGVYTDTLSLSEAMMEDMMVAVLIDGKLISQENGGPVRLITPRLYAYKSVKWLVRIELIEQEHIGYWEKRGYPQNAWVRKY
ncbi:molybdopterin-dependent oxidoreductase [Gracilibacillus massiliensis]|uniref:molybdopterin-dependent oxidoreductase n=1 Tax=Gracilibacillus massiliensis TaxID=1564956 RepID=UPI00071E15A2|nr:molybdopterin-dependent oxidoreductase [Gracilibacillus massiliensis]